MNFDILYEKDCKYRIQSKDISLLKEYFNKKAGWIYIAKTKDNNYLKIGRTSKNPINRAKTLSSTGVFNDYVILYSLKVFNQFIAEKFIHNKLKKYRVLKTKEFFYVNESIAIQEFTNAYENEKECLQNFLDLDVIKDDINLLEFALKKY